MIRRARTALVGTAVLAVLAGCAQQEPFGLPDLTPGAASPTVGIYPSYGYGHGYGIGYPNGYRPGYGYGYADPYYAGQGPYPYAYGYGYGYGYGYNPYAYGYGYSPYPRYVVVPCADNNRDGRCDTRPPKDREHQGEGHRRGHDRDDPPPAQVRPEPRRATPPDAPTPRGPRPGKGRQPMTGDDVAPSRPTQEP